MEKLDVLVLNAKIRCPCSKCKNLKFLDSEEVKVHLYKKGFKSDYWYWTCHGESDPSLSAVNTYLWTATTTQEGHNEAKKIIDKLCKRNEEIRKKQTIPHTCGAETLARRHELKIETGKTVDRGPMWNMTHKRKDGSYVNDKAMEIGEKIENHISQGLEASSEFPGHVQGLGLGVVPTIAFKHTTTRHSGMRFDSSSGCTSSGDLQQKVIKMESQMQALIAYICAKEGGRIPKELASLFPNSTQQASDVGSGASSGGSNTHLVDHQGPPNGI